MPTAAKRLDERDLRQCRARFDIRLRQPRRQRLVLDNHHIEVGNQPAIVTIVRPRERFARRVARRFRTHRFFCELPIRRELVLDFLIGHQHRLAVMRRRFIRRRMRLLKLRIVPPAIEQRRDHVRPERPEQARRTGEMPKRCRLIANIATQTEIRKIRRACDANFRIRRSECGNWCRARGLFPRFQFERRYWL